MKRFVIAMTMVLCLAFVSGQVFAQRAQIVFETSQHDFGEIMEQNGDVVYNFVFKNEGKTPLVLHNVQASCGCTTPTWPRTPIQPGASSSIEVKFNPKNRPGSFNKTITVISNADPSSVQLHIMGKVLEHEPTLEELYPAVFGDMRLSDSHMPFTQISPGEVKTAELKVINTGTEPITPSFLNVPPHVKIACNPATLQPNEKGVLVASYDAALKNDWGYVSDQIYVTFNNEKRYNNRLVLSASIVEDFSKLTEKERQDAPKAVFDTNHHDFGVIQQTEKVEHDFIITNNGIRPLLIHKVKASCGCTAVTPEKVVLEKGESTKIHVAFDPKGKSGRQNKTINVTTNDPDNSTQVLRISSNIAVPGAGELR